MAGGDRRSAWTLLTSHGHVLVEIARNPHARIRELSAAAGITERATAAIVADLEAAGYVTRSRVGRRNHYAVNLDLPFRHSAQRDLRVGPFVELLSEQPGRDAVDGNPANGDRADRLNEPERTDRTPSESATDV